jgi:hypothetical protein
MRGLDDIPLGAHETESPDPYEVRITRPNGGLWKLEAFRLDKRMQTVVSSSWHTTRAEALKEAQSFA